MPAERYYLNEALENGREAQLADQEFHHLTRVMRTKVGETVELVNGQGTLAHATVHTIEKRQALLSIHEVQNTPKPTFEVILAQALPRPNRLDFILEKGTELGMTQLWLFPAEQSEKKELSENQLERAQAIMVAAMKQCGRLWLPILELKPGLEKWHPINYTYFFGDVDPKAKTFKEGWQESQPKQGAVIVIGPESGLTENEEKKLKEMGAEGVKLHPNILRTDTASLVALSLVYSQLH